MNEQEQAELRPVRRSSDIGLTQPVWPSDDWSDDEDDATPAEGFAGDLTSLGYFLAALRRSARLWCAFALIGFMIGFGVFVKFPSPYQASASLLLTAGPNTSAATAVLDDQEIASSRAVAGYALHKLGLQESAASLASSYTVTAVTDRVLQIVVKAKSSELAVREANAVASAFLAFQARLLRTQETLTNAGLEQQIAQGKQQVDAVERQISQVSAQRASPAQKSELSTLRDRKSQAVTALAQLEQAVATYRAGIQVGTTQAINASQVLDSAAPLPLHRKRTLVEYAGGGLLGGLVLGMGFVIIRALVSDRLRRRDEIARVLGAPVKLSVGKVGAGRRGLAASKSPELRRIVAHLGSAITSKSPRLATLAVVPVDDIRVSAVCIASLAISCSEEGYRVVLADLCPGAPAARLLGMTETGVRMVSANGAKFVVAIPDDPDVLPTGPLDPASKTADDPLSAACASADVLLTFATLDPSLGGEHLSEWALSVAVVVTAGRSSVARVQAVGEMIRLAGPLKVSAVLLRADKTDESLGAARAHAVIDASALARTNIGAEGPGTIRAHGTTPGRGPMPSRDANSVL